MIIAKVTESEIVDYYNDCWLNRFKDGHNPASLAMHLGYFEHESNNDLAKVDTNRFLLNQLQIPQYQPVRIIDLGCGVGGTCIYLSKYNPGSEIKGVNISFEQVAFAKEQAKLQNCDKNIEFIARSYVDTGLPDESFDFVYGVESICHAERKSDVFEEAYRLLKVGGKFALLDYFEVNKNEDSLSEKLLNDFRRGWAVNEYLKDVSAALQKIGFADIQEKDITHHVLPGIQNSYDKAIRKLSSLQLDGNSWMHAHLQACKSLKQLVENNLIEYRVVVAVK